MSKPAAPSPTATQAEAAEYTEAELAEIENYNLAWRDAQRYGAGWETPQTGHSVGTASDLPPQRADK